MSHSFIERYAGKKFWIMKIDADEIYDQKRLINFKREILRGDYKNTWLIKSVMLNVLTKDKNNLSGFFSPPCQNSSEIYNFSLIKYWKDCKIERLHYGKIKFKKNNKKSILIKQNWFKSSYRCIHHCFDQRSSMSKGFYTLNKAPFEIVGNHRLLKSQIKFFCKLFISFIDNKISFLNSLKVIFLKRFLNFRKIEQYSRGKLIKNINISKFNQS